MKKLDWLAANALLKVGGAALVNFLCHWRSICKFLQPTGSKCELHEKSIKHCNPIGSLN
jgi:hypothetical protein